MIVSAVILLYCLLASPLKAIGGMQVKAFVQGVFGLASYALFTALFSLGLALFRNYTVSVRLRKTIGAGGMFLFALLILHLISSTRYLSGDTTFNKYIYNCYENADTFGGIVLALPTYPIVAAAKVVGTYIIYSIFFILSLLIFIDFDKLKARTKSKAKNIINTNMSFNRRSKRELSVSSSSGRNTLFVSEIINENQEPKSIRGFNNNQSSNDTPMKLYSWAEDYRSSAEEVSSRYSQDTKVEAESVISTPAPAKTWEAAKPFASGIYSAPKPPKIEQTETYPLTPKKIYAPPKIIDAEQLSKDLANRNAKNTENDAISQIAASNKTQGKVPYIIDGDLISEKLRSSKYGNTLDSNVEKFKEILRKGRQQSDLSFEDIINRRKVEGAASTSINTSYKPFGAKYDAVVIKSKAENQVELPLIISTKDEDEQENKQDSIINTQEDIKAKNTQEEIKLEENFEEDIQEEDKKDDKIIDLLNRNFGSSPLKEPAISDDFDEYDDEAEYEALENNSVVDDDDSGYYKVIPAQKSRDDELLSKIKELNKQAENARKVLERPTLKKKEDVNQIQIEDYVHEIAPKVSAKKPVSKKEYVKPPIDLLVNDSTFSATLDESVHEKAAALEQLLEEFRTPAKVIGITKGPAATRYELQMPPGISVKRIADKANDIAYTLASRHGVRIETPIPGKQAVGIEIPNDIIEKVSLREIIESREFMSAESILSFALGKDIAGKNIVTDLAKMPHLLVAGATNSGKSSCLNSIITSLIYRASPKELRFILVDPKRVEFTSYRGLPHMLTEKPITEPEHVLNAFDWAMEESENRFDLFSTYKVRDIKSFNNMSIVRNGEIERLPYIVIVVDELADLMMQAKRDFEDRIRAIAQKSRAAGIHLILATQRPSVDVITGTIKANLPSRIAFAVTSFPDSKTILDQGGAEKLLGSGDMLYAPVDKPEPIRVQGAYVTNDEVLNIVDFVVKHNESDFDPEFEARICKKADDDDNAASPVASTVDELDPNFYNILRMFIEYGQASATLIQRRFRYGYAKASRIMDQMELKKYISAFDGTNKPRKVLITQEQFDKEFGEFVDSE